MVSLIIGGLALAAAKGATALGAVTVGAKLTGFAAALGVGTTITAATTGITAPGLFLAATAGPAATIGGTAAAGGISAAAGGISAAGIASGLALLGGVVTGVGSYMQQRAQGQAAAAQARLDAAQAEYAAASIRRQGEQDVTDTKRRLQRSIGATKAQVARTGLTLGGSAFDILFAMNSEADEEISNIRLAAETKAYGYDTQAALAQSASSYKSGGSLIMSVTGGLLRAGSSAVSAYNSLSPTSAKGVLAQG